MDEELLKDTHAISVNGLSETNGFLMSVAYFCD